MEGARYFLQAAPCHHEKNEACMVAEFRRESNNAGRHFSILFHLLLTR